MFKKSHKNTSGGTHKEVDWELAAVAVGPFPCLLVSSGNHSMARTAIARRVAMR